MWLLCLPLLALLVHATCVGPLAPRLAEPGSVRVLDRSGQILAEVRDERFDLSIPVRRDELGPWLEPALLAAEDARFFWHPGIDPLALLRAAVQAARAGRVVSGGSTLTQQLARTLFERPRTLAGKWRELAYALRLEAELDKGAILEAYLNRVYFGPRLRGVGAASRHYFDKPPSALSLAEAAALVAIVQAPSRLDPERHPERLLARRDLVLGRMLARGLADAESVARARATPLWLRRGHVLPGAYHFVRAAVSGKLAGAATGAGELHSTIDGELQARLESLVRSFAARFAEQRASAAAVLVVENQSAAVRAYVGAPDHRATAALGQNDGVLALRQPGSTLKPFVYALAIAEQGLGASSTLPDLEQRFGTATGQYLPHNHDRRFHGPVRLGQALASSLNVPAVALAERLGPERVQSLLASLGFAHLEERSTHYGPAIALGVAEVRLTELVAAYASLARAGEYLPLRFFESAEAPLPRRVLPADVTREVLRILADPRERAATFGRDGPLDLEQAVSVKTGTSKGNRDNWVLGAGATHTVGVWVGNFDGSPMLRGSAAAGSGPLFHAVMEELGLRSSAPRRPPLAARSEATPEVYACALSGLLAGPDCPHRLALGPERNPPRRVCDWHRRLCAARADAVTGRDPRDPDCPVLEVLPERYAAWARDTGRLEPRARAEASSDVASGDAAQPATRLLAPAITFPRAGQRFVYDERLGSRQTIVLSALGDSAGARARVTFEIDGDRVCEESSPAQASSSAAASRTLIECAWPLARGEHVLVVQAGARSSRLAFGVE